MNAVAPVPNTDPDVDYDLTMELARGRADGSLIRMKAKLILEQIALPAIARQMQAVDAPFSTILSGSQHLMKLADMEPKPNVTTLAGTGLQLVFNIPSPGVTGSAQGLEGDIIDQAPLPVITMRLDDPMPPTPPGFTMPPFALTNDLVGPPRPKDPA